MRRLRRYRNGRSAAVLSGGYAALVALLGVVSVVILLTVQDPILITGVILMVVTLPLGPLVWWAWDVVPLDLRDPVLLIVILTVVGLLQAYVLWRLARGRALQG
ncbi:SCO4225 family membrane protein [Nonomuraea wenchangensis]|uniref:SCO4225 family membrane protein n=1 Tax=Nonomuraea wenchangensis TaxID=568860 RepID=UPI0037B2104C